MQQRLLARAKPETASEIRKVLALVSDQVGAKAATRSYADAMAVVRIRHDERALGEEDVVEYADAGKYEETIAALATICGVPVEVVDRLMGGDRYDPVLILARSAGFSWNTTRAIITTVPGAKGTSTQAIEAARENYERLTTTDRTTRGPVLAGPSGNQRPAGRLDAAEGEVGRDPPFAFCLGLVTRAGKIRPGLAPLIRALGASIRSDRSATPAPAPRRHSRECRWRNGIRRRA